MKGMLAPTFKEVLQGHIEVRQTIKVPNVGIIAGSYVLDGKVPRRHCYHGRQDIFTEKIQG